MNLSTHKIVFFIVKNRVHESKFHQEKSDVHESNFYQRKSDDFGQKKITMHKRRKISYEISSKL